MSPVRTQLERVVTPWTVGGPGDEGEENQGLVLGEGSWESDHR